MGNINGVVIGIVKSLEDSEKLGRVQVHFPWLSDSNKSRWARIATLMAGPKRGSWFMPEIEDEVLVAFEHGDSQSPYIVGFLWNGQDKPPNSDIDVNVRRIKTTSGHIIEFDDRAGKEAISIRSQGGHEIHLKDAIPAKITIATNGGQTIEMDDQPAKITIKTSMGNQVSVSDAPPGIKISSLGTLNINCLQATVTAPQITIDTAALTVNAAVAKFSGIVQAPFVMANVVHGELVAGSVYTPGAGNIM